jgi:long-chain acyl-CoA synthetase
VKEASTDLLVLLPSSSNVTDVLLERCAASPDASMFERRTTEGWQEVSAAAFLAEVTSVAKGLLAVGVSPGDRVAVMSQTRYEWAVADFAIWFAGAITVPIYETSSAAQVEWILQDSGARTVLADSSERMSVVEAAAAQSTALAEAHIGMWRLSYEGDGANLSTLAALGAGVADSELEAGRATATLADTASIVYTSGTTGRPRGCCITHANFALVAENATVFLPEALAVPGARTLMFLPLAHVLARAVQLACLASGTTVGHSSSETLLPDLSTFRPTFLLSVPRIFEKVLAAARQQAESSGRGRAFRLAERTAVSYSGALEHFAATGRKPGAFLRARHAVFDRLVYARIRALFGGSARYAISGASPLNRRDAHFFRGAGVDVLEGYGLTETTAPCTVNIPSRTRVGTVGIPLPGTTIRIADDGEVLVQGMGVFSSYHNNPSATAEAFTDGFFRTGDLGSLDEDGFLTITGRKKDLLVTAGGKNVSPGPLEEQLRAARLISQAVVVGEGRPFIAALLTLDEAELPAYCAAAGMAPLSAADAATDPRIRAELQRAVDAANRSVSRAEAIRSFTVLAEDFSVASGHLTQSLKVKRATVVQDYADEIDALYKAPRPAR